MPLHVSALFPYLADLDGKEPKGMWLSITISAILALGLVSLLVWRVGSDRLYRIHWFIFTAAAGMFWGCLSFILHLVYWDSYYRYFAPAYVNWLTPIAVLFYAIICLGLRWLAGWIPGNFAVNFCVLGAIESIPEHILAIYKFQILEIPGFQGVEVSSIFIFAFFEYATYWSLVLFLVAVLGRVWPGIKNKSPSFE